MAIWAVRSLRGLAYLLDRAHGGAYGEEAAGPRRGIIACCQGHTRRLSHGMHVPWATWSAGRGSWKPATPALLH